MTDFCKGCKHIQHTDGGYCYMFAEKPEGEFCGQHSVVQNMVRQKKGLAELFTLLALQTNAEIRLENGKK